MAAAAASAAKQKLRYLSAWFCPYAHRATLALSHHASRVDHEWVESLGWEKRKDEEGVTGEGHEWWYHWKAPELLEANPSGLVPTLIPVDAEGKARPDRAVYESLICIDYVDAMSGATGRDRLVPEDPYEAARVRLWADRLNREAVSPYYGVLVRKEEDERREHFRSLLKGLRNFSRELERTEGPLLLPEAQLSSADLSLIPWAWRYYVFEHYRGPDYAIPRDDPALGAYHRWYDHVFSLPSVLGTCPDKDRYLEHIGKYADSSARSKVANAVRRGAAAHEIDDEIDEY